jgi:hypothetical protein
MLHKKRNKITQYILYSYKDIQIYIRLTMPLLCKIYIEFIFFFMNCNQVLFPVTVLVKSFLILIFLLCFFNFRGNSKYHYYGIRVKAGSVLTQMLCSSDEIGSNSGGSRASNNNNYNGKRGYSNRGIHPKTESQDSSHASTLLQVGSTVSLVSSHRM